MEQFHGLSITNISSVSSNMTYTYNESDMPLIEGNIDVEEATIYVFETSSAINWGDVTTYRDTRSNCGDIKPEVLALKTEQIETNSDGTFEMGLLPGQYSILIDKPGYLDYIITNLQIGAGNIDLGEIVLEPGDINKDGVVDVIDIGWIKDAVAGVYNVPSGNRDAYDINGDGVIDILDVLEVIRSAKEGNVRTISIR